MKDNNQPYGCVLLLRRRHLTTVEAAAATAAVAVTVRIAVDRGKEKNDDEIIFLHDKNGGLLNDIWTPNYIFARQ